MKRVITFVAVILFTTTSAYADDKLISFEALPSSAQKFIEKYFASESVKYITVGGRSMYREYDVKLKSGFDVEFDFQGGWFKVDSKLKSVPSVLVPDEILEYVKCNFSGESVREIELGRDYRCMVELSDGTELEFNKKFEVIAVELD